MVALCLNYKCSTVQVWDILTGWYISCFTYILCRGGLNLEVGIFMLVYIHLLVISQYLPRYSRNLVIIVRFLIGTWIDKDNKRFKRVLDVSLQHTAPPSDISLALWCHDTHPHQDKSPPTLQISHAHQTESAMSICAETMKQRVIFEALLKAITIGVESTHDNWFAGSKWETTTNSVGGGGDEKKNSMDWHPVTVINFPNRPVWRSV